jgi:4-hydroxy-3-polyprenylbenzoate decarboxylase
MRVLVGISGASGSVYGIRLLEELKAQNVEVHLIISRWGRYTIECETDISAGGVAALADFCYDDEDLAAAVSSGSFPIDAMVIAPCSMKTLAGIAAGFTEGLIIRAADVALKERRRLILLTRESPLSEIHLENMLRVTRAGGMIMPPMPAFYTRPSELREIVDQSVGRVLEHIGLSPSGMKRWGEGAQPPDADETTGL